jgi:hypothetical protein
MNLDRIVSTCASLGEEYGHLRLELVAVSSEAYPPREDWHSYAALIAAVKDAEDRFEELARGGTAIAGFDPDAAIDELLEDDGPLPRCRRAIEAIGEWLPEPRSSNSPELEAARNHAERIARDLQELEGSLRFLSSERAVPIGLRGIGHAVEDIGAYPLLTLDGVATPQGGDGGAARSGSAGRNVDAVLRQVIGRPSRYLDARQFESALTSAFAVNDDDGRRQVVWRPRSFSGEATLGSSVTGAQASLYTRARDALLAVVPLVHGLRSLRSATDVEEVDAARAVVESQFRSLVDELGAEGGPRVLRVDQLFESLLDDVTTSHGGQVVKGGLVGFLGFVLGYADEDGRASDERVNTIAEEEAFSSFVLLRDHLRATRASWEGFRDEETDFGTSLYLLERALTVVAESVEEVESALGSVFVGDSERAVIDFATGEGGSMLVSELFSWIRSFAAEEAPTMVHEGGRRGLGPVIGTADRLGGLVEALVRQSGSRHFPDGFRHPRVSGPLRELSYYLRRVGRLAGDARTTRAEAVSSVSTTDVLDLTTNGTASTAAAQTRS